MMNNRFNALIFSKEYEVGVIIQDYIKQAGYDSQVFDREEAAYEGFLSGNFTFCLIDYDDRDRIEARKLASTIKISKNVIPVIFLCEHPTREDMASMFSCWADDVIHKPLDADILLARIKAIQKRYRPQLLHEEKFKTYLIGKFKFDSQKQLLSTADQTTKLTAKETELLILLCQHANATVERDFAIQAIWKYDSNSIYPIRSLDVYITKLRKLLRGDPTVRILNVHGKGYKLSTHENDN